MLSGDSLAKNETFSYRCRSILLLLFAIGLMLPSVWLVERSVVNRAAVPTIVPSLKGLNKWCKWPV